MAERSPLLEVSELQKHFGTSSSIFQSLFMEEEKVQAVDGVSFDVGEQESIGIIGESGCGKTTLLKTLIGLHSPSGGEITFKGKDMSEFGRKDWKEYRRNVQIIFQDPFNSLDPKFTVREIIKEPLDIHGIEDKDDRIREVLEQVELAPVDRYMGRTPKQLSGGEKQRVSIGRAIAVEPDLLLADEPTSMLDVSTQAAILELFSKLKEVLNLSILYISHDVTTVALLCQRIEIMYLGRIVESGPTETLINDPKHPYSEALISAIPVPDPEGKRERTEITGSPPDPINIGEGCRFRDRCPERMDVCEKTPRFVNASENTQVACHLYYDHEKERSQVESQSQLP